MLKIACGYNVNIDHLIQLGKLDLELDAIPELTQLDSISQLEIALGKCILEDQGFEILTWNPRLIPQIQSRLGSGRDLLGGNSGNFSRFLSKLGAIPILNLISRNPRQLRLLHPRVKIPQGSFLRFPRPRSRDPELVHLILEYQAGSRLRLGSLQYTASMGDRFILSYDPVNTQLQIDPQFLEILDRFEIDAGIFSGFHLVKMDGASRNIQAGIQQINQFSDSGIYSHLELGYFQDLNLLKHLIFKSNPASLGMNELELRILAKELGLSQISDPRDPIQLISAGMELRELKSCEVVVHTREYSFCLGSQLRPIKAGLELGSRLASRYAGGELIHNARGIQALAKIKSEFNAHISSNLGVAKLSPDTYLCLRISQLRSPKIKLGLGDAFVAGYVFHRLIHASS